MALMARSIEMSFSASRLRRTLRSMSIGLLLIRALVRAVTRVLVCAVTRVLGCDRIQAGELDLYLARAEGVVAVLAALPVDVDPHPVLVRAGDPALDGRREGGGIRFGWVCWCERGGHQAADGTAPVPRIGERRVHARR